METKVANGEVFHDYIEHGSPEHLAWLGLRKATKDDKIQFRGYAFAYSPYGVEWDDDAELKLLKGKVSGFLTKPEPPTDAPDMWLPYDSTDDVPRGIV